MKKASLFIILISILSVLMAQDSQVVNSRDSNRHVYYPNEPSVCISKKSPFSIIIGANINKHYVSTDDGKSWLDTTFYTPLGMWGDPVLAAPSFGGVYLAHLSNTKNKIGYYKIDRIVIQKSVDGGITFDSGQFVGFNGAKMQDKPWLSFDEIKTSPYFGSGYISWTEFDKINSKKKKHHSRIRFASMDAKTGIWARTKTISDGVGDALDDDHTLEGATTAVGKNGDIYCVWAGHNKLYFDKSLDGGITWGIDKIIGHQKEGWTLNVPHEYRTNGLPFLVCDKSNGKNSGRLYLVYGDIVSEENGADVLIMYSDDKGENWSKPITVHQDREKSQYFGNCVIDQKTGLIYVVYYNRVNSKYDVFADVYLAQSSDGGIRFTEKRINKEKITPMGDDYFTGDYIDLDVGNGKIACVWYGYSGGPKIYCSIENINGLGNKYLIYNSNTTLKYIQKKRKYWDIYLYGNGEVAIKVMHRKKQKIMYESTILLGYEEPVEEFIRVRRKRKTRLMVGCKN